MNDHEIEVMAWCSSVKENVTIGFGVCYDPTKETLSSLGSDWIIEGISDSFWENYTEFEPGLYKANSLIRNDPTLSIEQALYEVFGEFCLSFDVAESDEVVSCDVDINRHIYSLLENCSTNNLR